MTTPPDPHPPRIFLDASVIFAAALSANGSARDLIQTAIRGAAELVASTFVMIEVERNLKAKAPHALSMFHVFQQSGMILIVDPPSELVAQIATMIEPKDAPIVAAVVAAQTSYLASYDRKHLLSRATLIAQQFHLTVDTPDQLLRILVL